MKNIFDKLVESQTEEVSQQSPPQDEIQPDSAFHAQRDAVQTPTNIKIAVQELLRHGFLEEADRADAFRTCLVHVEEIRRAFEPLDLTLKVDSHRGVAFLAVAQVDPSSGTSEEDGWSHPLVRKQRLTLEQSLLLAILRQAFAMHEQEFGVGQSCAKVAIDDLLPNFLTYFGDTGSDAKNESRLLQLLDQLKTHGVVSEVDKQQELVVRPLIAHVANPESLAALLRTLQERAQSSANKAGGT